MKKTDRVEIRTGKTDRDDRVLKGLQDKGTVNFNCKNCGELLMVFQLTSVDQESPTVEVLTRVAVKCCLCDGFSLVQQLSGQFYPGAPSDQMAFDILDDYSFDDAPEVDVLFKAWSK